MASIFWYDLETFGKNPFYDRIAQFAGLRTDDNFEPIGDPTVLYCRLSPDYLPDPGACMVTGITPENLPADALPEQEFINRILQEFSRPGTCVCGYNSIRFDDEFIRNALYRNFYDPYEREYRDGNSRWDILDLLRTARDLRPEGITWADHEDGRPDFTLETLAAANGIDHKHAHDALSDVYATIGMAKLVFEKQPKLFRYLFKLRSKKEVWKQIDLYKQTPFLHTSGMFTSQKGCTSLVMPLTVDPNNGNCVLSFDLRQDPTPLINLSVDEIRQRMFTPASQMTEERINLKGVHANRAPAISPAKMLDEATAEKLGIDMEKCRSHYRNLRKNPETAQKIRQVFTQERKEQHKDPDMQIYSGGFFKDADREGFEAIRHASPEELMSISRKWEDPRIPEMLWRYTARNHPETLSSGEKQKWKSFCASRILVPAADDAMRLSEYRKKLESYKEDKNLPPRKKLIVRDLEEYADKLEKEILS